MEVPAHSTAGLSQPIVDAGRPQTATGLPANNGSMVVSLGGASLGLSIFGWCCCAISICSFGLGLGAVISGYLEMQALKKERVDPAGKELVMLGFWLGAVGLGLTLLYFLVIGGMYAVQIYLMM